MKQFDYQFLYNSWYRRFPNVVYWTTLSIVGLAALIPGIILCFDDITVGIGACIIIFGLLLAFGAAFLSRWITAILLSQKIIATDALLAMQNGNVSAPAVMAKQSERQNKKYANAMQKPIAADERNRKKQEQEKVKPSISSENEYVDFLCPYCGEGLSYSKEVLTNNSQLVCPYCNKSFNLEAT